MSVQCKIAALLVSICFFVLPATARAQPKRFETKPKEIDKATVEAWEKRGFKVGWMGIKNNWLLFSDKLDDMKLVDADLKKLPSIDVPFGIDLYISDVTEAGLKELITHKNLCSLDLQSVQITDAGMKDLISLKKLSSLVLSSDALTNEGME